MKSRSFLARGIRVSGVALVAGTLLLTGCSGGGAGGGNQSGAAGGDSEGVVKVGVSMPTQTSERWIADGDAVKEELEAAGHTVDLQFANDDIPTQTQQIDQMITNGAQVLVVAAIDGTALSSQLDAAGAAGIPVISYDRLIRDNENVDFYVSFDNYKVGVAQATALLSGLGITDADGDELSGRPTGPLNIELFAGSPDDNNAGFFFDGAMDTLKPYLDDGTLVVKSTQTDFDQVAILRWSQEGAQKRMEDLVTSTYGGGTVPLAGVLSPFDGLSRGIITALQNAGYGSTIADGLPVVTGQDAEVASVKLINEGVQQSTIFKDTRTLAAQAVKVVESIAAGEEPEANDTTTYDNGVKVVPSYLLPVETIYKDDIKSKLIDSGYYTQTEVEEGVVK
ncbi:sugar ABC transporter substrate-binding protein [Brooklawnia cerclae]|uniref:Multiple sugar transport system substrate-binding protein n=1 Tax=Brooklawnia cerclae TaxID=349934 RepID=A0ABX0SAV0_9ACTN|nr:multiple monosaccharide ABC transporter substrate-binding protein [Brooklawnia cerclae]NIH55518.1 putative multiple sugar transport system substrate-binding protein [Brooklawnia cerclae]